ncbi:MAG: adenylate/guanylate cyclase domain-containing protein [Myxococcota bacterium]
MSNTVEARHVYRLEAPAMKLWPLIADTGKVNQMAALSPMRFAISNLPGKSRPLIKGVTRFLGQDLTWEEHPFEWVEGVRFGVLRTFDAGLFYELKVVFSVQPVDEKTTDVAVDISAVPRGKIQEITFKTVGIPQMVRGFGKAFQAMARYAAGLAQEVDQDAWYEPRAEVVTAAASARTALLKAGFSEESVDGLIRYLAARPDDHLTRIRPYELAAPLKLSRLDVLRLFLHGTRAGLLSMSWDLLCPHCRGAKQQTSTLAGVVPGSSCDSCGITFDVEFDRNVEVTFSPAPHIRKVEDVRFCFGGPSMTPHVRMQQDLAPGETREVQVALADGRYRLRAQGIPGSAVLEVGMVHVSNKGLMPIGDNVVDVALDPVSITATPSSGLPRRMTLKLRNLTSERALVVLETSQWLDDAASAATVTSLMEFRDLFSREVLSPGQNIKVGRVTLMFTDLKGSTALYEQVGDPRAFALVREHFKLLYDAIQKSHGAIVKTIGDAVMAVFDKPYDALDCALEIQRRALDLNKPGEPPTIIKIGVHSGPALAVEQNEKLDYFGNTVNVAARTQNESVGWDVVITDGILADSRCDDLARSVEGETFEADLKGIKGKTRLYRLWPVGRR